MTIRKVLAVTATVLFVVLAVQLGWRYHNKPGATLHAAWYHNPTTVAEAYELSDDVFLGRVLKTEPADDLVYQAPPDAPEEDRYFSIPVDLITLQVEKRYKGKTTRRRTVKLFSTGRSREGSPAARQPPTTAPPPKPPDGVDRPDQLPSGDEHATTISVMDGLPILKKGDLGVFFTQKGRKLKVNGNDVQTQILFNPACFYGVTDNKLEPAAKTGFATRLRGRTLNELEGRIRRSRPRVIGPIRGRPEEIDPRIRPQQLDESSEQ